MVIGVIVRWQEGELTKRPEWILGPALVVAILITGIQFLIVGTRELMGLEPLDNMWPWLWKSFKKQLFK